MSDQTPTAHFAGPLRVHPANGRYFTDDVGPPSTSPARTPGATCKISACPAIRPFLMTSTSTSCRRTTTTSCVCGCSSSPSARAGPMSACLRSAAVGAHRAGHRQRRPAQVRPDRLERGVFRAPARPDDRGGRARHLLRGDALPGLEPACQQAAWIPGWCTPSTPRTTSTAWMCPTRAATRRPIRRCTACTTQGHRSPGSLCPQGDRHGQRPR